MIAQIKFTYQGRDKMVDLAKSDTIYEELKTILVDAPEPDHRQDSYAWPYECVIDLETDGRRFVELGIDFEVKKFKGTMPLKSVGIDGGVHNVYVQIPHIGLLAIDEVQLEEDCCTDVLQRRLNEGWRILCICPPNAARRPDYILGRTKERA